MAPLPVTMDTSLQQTGHGSIAHLIKLCR
jgi:hypothetical protein